jgi:hypothetical protein
MARKKSLWSELQRERERRERVARAQQRTQQQLIRQMAQDREPSAADLASQRHAVMAASRPPSDRLSYSRPLPRIPRLSGGRGRTRRADPADRGRQQSDQRARKDDEGAGSHGACGGVRVRYRTEQVVEDQDRPALRQAQ